MDYRDEVKAFADAFKGLDHDTHKGCQVRLLRAAADPVAEVVVAAAAEAGDKQYLITIIK